jgi:hypothetical protein
MSSASGAAPLATLKARKALCLGIAIWGLLCVAVGCNFQWGLWGPFNASGLVATLLLVLLHAHGFFLGDKSRRALHLIKLALFIDFLVSILLALGSLIYFVNGLGKPWVALSSLCSFMSGILACILLANSLQGLLQPM